jgi:hypothetical protein
MATPVGNANAPMGLRPVGTLGSAGYRGRVRIYATSTSDTQAIGIGDPVILTTGGDANGVSIVTRLTSAGTSAIVGAVVGIKPDPTNLALGYRVASTNTMVFVDTDPQTIYEIADSSTSQTTSLTIADVGVNAQLVCPAVDTTTGNGKVVMGTTVGTTTTLSVKVLNLSPKVGNLTGDWAKYEVIINNHVFRAGTAGI